MKDLDIGEDDGYVTVTIDGATQKLDLVDAWDRYYAILEEHGREPGFTARLPPFVESLGFPPCSQRVAIRFINRLSELISEVKKNDGGATWPAPAGFTASTSSPSEGESASSSERT